MSYNHFEELNKAIIQGLETDLIPIGFPRLEMHVALRPACYYLLGGFTGSGKTAFVDDAFVLNPFDFIKSPLNTSGLKLKIFYFSMERKRVFKLAKWIARKVFTDLGAPILSVNKILGYTSKQYKLTKDEHDVIKMYEPYVNELLEDCLVMIENPINPMGIKKVVDAYAEENGRFEQIDKHNRVYHPNNPKELVLVVYDTIGLQKKETRKYPNGDIVRLSSKKEIIDQSSEDARKFRDVYGYSVVKVSQFNREIANPIRIKNGDVEPQLEDFKESGCTQEDADVVLTLFDPMRYKVKDPSGYDLNKLKSIEGFKKYRSLKVQKNTFGGDDLRIGLAFQPLVGTFKEMPKLSEMTQEDYISIIDDSFFLR